jgi:hypothetical protein
VEIAMNVGVERKQETSLFVRLVGGRAYVNGFGDTRQAAMKKPVPKKPVPPKKK